MRPKEPERERQADRPAHRPPAPVPAGGGGGGGGRPLPELHHVTRATSRAVQVPAGEVLDLVARGHDEAAVLARLLQLGAKLRTGWEPRTRIGWLRDKAGRGVGDLAVYETAKRMLGRTRDLPLNWIEPHARGDPGPERVGVVALRAVAVAGGV